MSFDINSCNIRKIIWPVIAAVTAVIITVVAVSIFSSEKYGQAKGTVVITQGDGYVIVIPNGKSRVEIDGYLNFFSTSLGDTTNLDYSATSLDGTVAAVLISEEDTRLSSNTEGASLYLISDKPRLISEGVHSFWLATSGKAIAYTKEHDSRKRTAELWLYSSSKNIRITSNLDFESNCAISPDGKVVAFATSDNNEITGYVWNGALNRIGRDIQPFAVSDGARYVYYVREDELFVQIGMNSDSRESIGDADTMFEIYMNKDLSQLIYSTGSRAYITVKGGECESLSGGIRYFAVPKDTAAQRPGSIVIYDISSFEDTFYVNKDDAIVHISDRFIATSVARNVNDVNLAKNGKTLTYLRNESVYKLNGTNINAEAEEIVDGDVIGFVATADGSAVFYVNDVDELYYQKGKGKPTLVSDYYEFDDALFEYEFGWLGYGLFKGDTLFYVSDGELYVSTGGKGKAVGGINGEAQFVHGGNIGVFVNADDFGDNLLYYSTDGKKFELIYQTDF